MDHETMDNLILLLLLVKCVPFIMTIAIIFSLILLVVISGNIKNSPVTNGRIKLLQYLTISNLVGQIAVMVLLLHLSYESSTLVQVLEMQVLKMTGYLALYAAIFFGLFLGLNLFVFLFQLSIYQNVYYFPREILSRWRIYVTFAIAIPLLALSEIVFGASENEFLFLSVFRGVVVFLSVIFNVLAFIFSLFLSSQWIRSDLGLQEKRRALSIINKYFIPTLLWYPLCETICQVPLLIIGYYYAYGFNPEGYGIFVLILFWLLSILMTSIAHLFLFIYIEKPEFSWRILLQRLNMLWIIELPNFLLHVPPNNLNQAANLYEAMDDENIDNETLDELNQIIFPAQNFHLEAV